MADQSLQDRPILVTRPVGRADNLLAQLERYGAKPIHYPTIEIKPLEVSAEKLQTLLQQADYACFISPTSVALASQFFDYFPASMSLIAIGNKTARALEKANMTVSLCNSGFDSEALLEHHALQATHLQNKQIILFKGKGGRELLADTLQSRGASVHPVELYERQLTTLPALSSQTIASLSAITISSQEGLHNLLRKHAAIASLYGIPLIVPSERVCQYAVKKGFHTVAVADNATDEACLKALQYLFTHSGHADKVEPV